MYCAQTKMSTNVNSYAVLNRETRVRVKMSSNFLQKHYIIIHRACVHYSCAQRYPYFSRYSHVPHVFKGKFRHQRRDVNRRRGTVYYTILFALPASKFNGLYGIFNGREKFLASRAWITSSSQTEKKLKSYLIHILLYLHLRRIYAFQSPVLSSFTAQTGYTTPGNGHLDGSSQKNCRNTSCQLLIFFCVV